MNQQLILHYEHTYCSLCKKVFNALPNEVGSVLCYGPIKDTLNSSFNIDVQLLNLLLLLLLLFKSFQPQFYMKNTYTVPHHSWGLAPEESIDMLSLTTRCDLLDDINKRFCFLFGFRQDREGGNERKASLLKKRQILLAPLCDIFPFQTERSSM